MKKQLQDPYWVADPTKDGFPDYKFNREVIPPGRHAVFPDGVVGIRIDDDFWAVAALPYEEYKDRSVQDIVAELWPDVEPTGFGPDSEVWKLEDA